MLYTCPVSFLLVSSNTGTLYLDMVHCSLRSGFIVFTTSKRLTFRFKIALTPHSSYNYFLLTFGKIFKVLSECDKFGSQNTFMLDDFTRNVLQGMCNKTHLNRLIQKTRFHTKAIHCL